MRWQKINNLARTQPRNGTYNQWKSAVAEACNYRCVYCGIFEGNYGGIDNYHVDHFRPKSLRKFKHLVHAIHNLYLACAICNRFKGNDWPEDPKSDHSVASYIDPGEHALRELFRVSQRTYNVTSNAIAAKYMIERLGLNRVQLLIDRRMEFLMQRSANTQVILKQLYEVVKNRNNRELLAKVVKLSVLQAELSQAQQKIMESRPYLPGHQKKVTT